MRVVEFQTIEGARHVVIIDQSDALHRQLVAAALLEEITEHSFVGDAEAYGKYARAIHGIETETGRGVEALLGPRAESECLGGGDCPLKVEMAEPTP